MLRIEIIDDDCAEGEAYTFSVLLNTPWEDIKKAIGLFYPDATCVSIIVVEE